MIARRTVTAAILLVACDGEEPVVSIPDFHARSALEACERMGGATDGLASVGTARPTSDSTFVVLDPAGRLVALLDRDAGMLSSVALAAEGPGSVAQPMDAAASDSLIVVADGGRNRLVALSWQTVERWTQELAFPPQAVALAGDRVLIAALGMDPRIPGLIHERAGGRIVPLGIPFVHDADALARMFVNSVNLLGLPDGSAVVAHELIWPRAWRIPATGEASAASTPVPDDAAAQVGYVPQMPLGEGDLDDIAALVLSLTVDRNSGDLLYLTRSGRRSSAGHMEKAIVRVTSDFSYLGSIRLPFNATDLVLLAGRPDSLLVVDTDLQWHRCPVPGRNRPT